MMTNIGEIHQAGRDDLSQIAFFLESAGFIHHHLDWHPILDWIETQPFLLLRKDSRIQALLAAPQDPPKVAWIQCFAARDLSNLESAWQVLIKSAVEHLKSQTNAIYAIGLEDWFLDLLVRNHCKVKQTVVVLSWNHHVPSLSSISDKLTIRPMLEDDLEKVAEVDALSFEEQWINSLESLRLAYRQSEHTSVAVIDQKIIGYEITTASQFSAHLARLAVLPEFRRSHIAKSLVGEMLRYFSHRGMMQLTVNTQNDNAASLHLYQNLGFERTGEEYPILQL